MIVTICSKACCWKIIFIPEELIVLNHSSNEIKHGLITELTGNTVYPCPRFCQ